MSQNDDRKEEGVELAGAGVTRPARCGCAPRRRA